MNGDSDELSIEQWVYRVRSFTGTTSTQIISVNPDSQGWRVKRVQLYAAAAGASLVSPLSFGNLLNVAANGSLCFSPDAYAPPYTFFELDGDGSVLIIEYLYKAIPAGTEPGIVIT
jgi:hypothetical protein